MHGMELGLLILESVLLVATIILLLMSLKEGRGRDKLILEVSKATRVLTRHEYFITVVDTMMDADKEVLGLITGRLPTGEDAKRTKELAYNIEKLRSAGTRLVYIMPKFQDRLHVGHLYSQAGAEVYYSSCSTTHDLRYTVIDSKIALIGVPESIGEKEATRKGYRIPSEALAAMLKENFHRCLDSAVSFESFMAETLKQTGGSVSALAREIKLSEHSIEEVIKKYKAKGATESENCGCTIDPPIIDPAQKETPGA
jgi:hypothetical protein